MAEIIKTWKFGGYAYAKVKMAGRIQTIRRSLDTPFSPGASAREKCEGVRFTNESGKWTEQKTGIVWGNYAEGHVAMSALQ